MQTKEKSSTPRKSLTSFNRIILFIGFSLTALGVLVFFQMPKQEDPRIKQRGAIIQYVYPGASPEKIERLVVRPVEDQLASVEELKTYEIEIRLNVAIVNLSLRDNIDEISSAWREVERALERAERDLPEIVQSSNLDFYILDVESIVLAVTGSDDTLALLDAARTLKDELVGHPLIARVSLFGDPGEEILVEVPQKTISEKLISALKIADAIDSNNQGNSSGFLVHKGKRQLLESGSELRSIQDLASIEIEAPNLKTYRLDQLARIERTTASPPETIFRWNGKPSVGLGIVARQNIDITSFGKEISLRIEELQKTISPLRLEYVAFQPARSEKRIQDLLISLLSGMILIAVFLSLSFGLRTSLIVSFSVPAISLIGLFLYYLSGGVLHQISIAAFVISIGQFIDNIIVMIDAMKRRIQGGQNPEAAADAVYRELRMPMLFATLTGICAFIPLLSAQGSTADFVFAFPLVAVLTLVASYFFALYFVPVLSSKVLKSDEPPVRLPIRFIERQFIQLATGPFWKIASILILLILISGFSAYQIPKEFFPEADRNEFVFSIELGANADILATDQILRKAESFFKNKSEVESVASFAGGSIPKFYYNLPISKRSPQNAQMLITTKNQKQVKQIGIEAEARLSAKFPEVDFISYFLQQGPPIPAKIELRFFSDKLDRFNELIPTLEEILNSDSNLRAIRSDLDTPLIRLAIEARDELLADLNASRSMIASLTSFESSGLVAGEYRGGRDIVPIRLRSISNVKTPIEKLTQKPLIQGKNRDFSLNEISEISQSEEMSLIRRENGRRFLRVLADLKPGYTFNLAVKQIEPKLSQLKLSLGEYVEWGGDKKGAGEANQAVLKIVPIAALLLIVFLILEFGSFRKLLIALIALPVAILGVFPGLWIGSQSFGFMSLLGLLGLVGISINNIILLLEAMSETGSLEEAIGLRFRAIMMTTTLTILGLLPLTLEDSSLWPPLGWTMISGLITGTFATLILVPALYRLVFRSVKATLKSIIILFAFGGILVPHLAMADESIDQLMERLDQVNEVQSQALLVQVQNELDRSNFREAFYPKLSAGGEFFKRNTDLTTETVLGSVKAENSQILKTQLELRWNIFDWSKMSNLRNASRSDKKSSENQLRFQKMKTKLMIGLLALEILKIEQDLKLLQSRTINLESRRKDIETLLKKGRIARSDLIQLDLDLERLRYSENDLTHRLQNQRIYLKELLQIEVVPDIQIPHFSGLQNTNSGGLKLRPDEEMIRANAQALRHQARSQQSQSWPKIDLFARGIAVDGQQISQNHWSEVGVGFQWEIFGGGARYSQAEALQLRARQLEKQQMQIHRDRRFQKNEALREIESNYDLIQRLDRMKSQASENRKLEKERYFTGRIALKDLVAADEIFLQIERDIKVAAIDAVMACLHYQFSLGVALRSNCAITE